MSGMNYGRTAAGDMVPLLVNADGSLVVSGGVGGTGGSSGLTNTELRAAAVAVSGPVTDAQMRAAAIPVSAVALPLPAGAATAAGQATAAASLASLDAKIPALGSVTPLLASVATVAAGAAVAVASKQFSVVVSGVVSSGAGAATVAVQVSHDGAVWATIATVSLTLATVANADAVGCPVPYKYVRASILAISGTGAAVTATVGL